MYRLSPVRDHDLQVTTRILHVLLRHLRTREAHPHTGPALGTCFGAQLDRIRGFVEAGQPVLFTLPAFPCKSPNRNKVLGHLPDLGERLAVRALRELCREVEELYPPGARVVVCSDGHVFGDLIRVPDEQITEYGDALRGIIAAEGIESVGLFGLEDVYDGAGFDERRRGLTAEFAGPVESIRAEVHRDATARAHYRGVTRFLVEDANDGTYPGTKSALLRECRARAYVVIQRSRAWGDLVDTHHPDSVRLSIHPQPCGSAKFGIALLAAGDAWMTPWHSVAVQRADGRFVLMKRSDAARIGRLVVVDGRPSHYSVPA
jgi:pyoverdine/dityrosine biosynthesis protein Dit1